MHGASNTNQEFLKINVPLQPVVNHTFCNQFFILQKCVDLKSLTFQELISNDGNPLEMCGLVTHLHYHEPANLALAYLFRSGAIRKLIQEYKNDGDIQWALIVTMNFLFARRKLHVTQKGKIFKNSVVKLEPLPKIIRKVRKYVV